MSVEVPNDELAGRIDPLAYATRLFGAAKRAAQAAAVPAPGPAQGSHG